MLNIEKIENLYRNLELINIMLEEISSPILLVEQENQENFANIMCKNYTDQRIVEQVYKIDLIKKNL